MAKRGRFGAFSGILETGVVKSTVVDWTGDDANDREIDLGDDYDLVLVFAQSAFGSAERLGTAYAVRAFYGIYYNDTTNYIKHLLGAIADTYWQGKMTGADANKIKLGSSGASQEGCNRNTGSYRAVGLKLG